jgi:hypothetical protein
VNRCHPARLHPFNIHLHAIRPRPTRRQLPARNNTNSVSTLGQSAKSNYNQQKMQDVLNKLDEFLNAARR